MTEKLLRSFQKDNGERKITTSREKGRNSIYHNHSGYINLRKTNFLYKIIMHTLFIKKCYKILLFYLFILLNIITKHLFSQIKIYCTLFQK